MGYLHIDNLYKAQQILAFTECYALEKIHGTSAHIYWREGRVGFFSGGESHPRFAGLFSVDDLAARFGERFMASEDVTVYGEAYGGKQQHMSQTYGPELKFVCFDVKVGESWLAVPQAVDVVAHLGLEFVDYALVSTKLESINAERDKPSTQAKRNGIADDKVREGIVLRPVFEVTLNNGQRLIAKHKREEFSERGRPTGVELDPTKSEQAIIAENVATEWATPMRLEHVIDHVIREREDKTISMSDTGAVIAEMIADITREGAGEVEMSEGLKKSVGRRTVHLLKARIASSLVQS